MLQTFSCSIDGCFFLEKLGFHRETGSAKFIRLWVGALGFPTDLLAFPPRCVIYMIWIHVGIRLGFYQNSMELPVGCPMETIGPMGHPIEHPMGYTVDHILSIPWGARWVLCIPSSLGNPSRCRLKQQPPSVGPAWRRQILMVNCCRFFLRPTPPPDNALTLPRLPRGCGSAALSGGEEPRINGSD